jgi:putative membrane protein
MIRQMINGLCMALADSVPGVSGGTIAFILGFYDRFIGSIHDLVFAPIAKKKDALKYLIQLGIGWVIGMGAAALVLTSIFERNIYLISSLFIGFMLGAIPLIIKEEWNTIKGHYFGLVFLVAGTLLVALITHFNSGGAASSMTLESFALGKAIYLFLVGMIAICAMFLPGISGSTMLLIFGCYVPVMTAVKELLHLHLNYLPMTIFFGLGVVTGAVSVVKLIQYCLSNYRSHTIHFILGMMLGSFYAIAMGPATLEVPKAPLTFDTFQWLWAVIGLAIVLGLELVKGKSGDRDN